MNNINKRNTPINQKNISCFYSSLIRLSVKQKGFVSFILTSQESSTKKGSAAGANSPFLDVWIWYQRHVSMYPTDKKDLARLCRATSQRQGQADGDCVHPLLRAVIVLTRGSRRAAEIMTGEENVLSLWKENHEENWLLKKKMWVWVKIIVWWFSCWVSNRLSV